MQRTRKPNSEAPSAILCGDFHLRDDVPICRNPETFEGEQWAKLQFVKDLQIKHNCPVIHSGDLFNHWKPSPYLLAKTMEHLPDKFFTIFGNHDLPQHNLKLQNKCGIYALEKAGKLIILPRLHWGKSPEDLRYPEFGGIEDWVSIKNKSILVWHVMTYTGKLPWPDCPAPSAGKLLRKYPQYDLILTGHNHKPFWTKEENRLLLNPGSLMRQAADQIDYRPAVWLWFSGTNTVQPIYLPFRKESVSNTHLESKKDRDNRIDSFVSKLNSDFVSELSFEDNLEKLISENKLRDSVKQIIYSSIE